MTIRGLGRVRRGVSPLGSEGVLCCPGVYRRAGQDREVIASPLEGVVSYCKPQLQDSMQGGDTQPGPLPTGCLLHPRAPVHAGHY